MEVGKNYHSTQFWTCHLLLVFIFRFCFAQFSTLGWHLTQLTFLYQVILTLFVILIFLCHIPTYFLILFCFNPATPLSIHPCFCPIVASNFYSSWESTHLIFGLCQLFLKLQTCLVKIWPPRWMQQQLLRSSFVPTMRRNLTSGSASSRQSLQQQGSNRKNSNTPTLSPACPSKSSGTFWIP